MELKRGITGFFDPKDPVPFKPLSDRTAFRSHCHVVARTTGAKLRGIKDPCYCNYIIAVLEFSDCSVAALLNVTYPILAFAEPPTEGQVVFNYIDCPKLAEAFRSVGDYTVASSEELDRPLLREMCADLAPQELKRVRYFRPARIGDVIFNYWD